MAAKTRDALWLPNTMTMSITITFTSEPRPFQAIQYGRFKPILSELRLGSGENKKPLSFIYSYAVEHTFNTTQRRLVASALPTV